MTPDKSYRSNARRPERSLAEPTGRLGGRPEGDQTHISGALPYAAPPITSRVYEFGELKGVTASNLLCLGGAEGFDQELMNHLRQVALLTKVVMAAMNRASPGLPPDSLQSIVDMYTLPSARSVLLEGSSNNGGSLGREREAFGFGLLVTDMGEIQDLAEIPEEILREGPIVRAQRLFVTDTARHQMPFGEAASRILEEFDRIADGRRLVGKVLVGPTEDLDPVWLEAKAALEGRHFEDTGHERVEMAPDGKGGVRPLFFRWYVYPPQSEEAKARQVERIERHLRAESWVRARLSLGVAHFPVAGARLLYGNNGDNRRDLFRLAEMYPRNSIIGEVFGESSRPRAANGERPNLVQIAGRGEEQLFPNETLDGAYLSSVLPDIAHPGGELAELCVKAALENRVRALKVGAPFIVRDTVNVSGPVFCLLSLSKTDGEETGDDQELSTASFFRKWIKEYADLQALGYDRADLSLTHTDHNGHEVWSLPFRLAQEFEYKMAYRKDAAREGRRIFTVTSGEALENTLAGMGMRILRAGPDWNQWVIDNHRREHVQLKTLGGTPIPELPTNYVVVAQKVGQDEGVGFTSSDVKKATGSFLGLRGYVRTREDGSLEERDLVTRQDNGADLQTLDVVPYFFSHGELFLVGRRDFPRPICNQGNTPLGEWKSAGYFMEQLARITPSEKLADPTTRNEVALEALSERAGIAGERVRSLDRSFAYFTAPDVIDELVIAQPVEVEPALSLQKPEANFSGFSTSGVVQPFNAQELIWAAQLGGVLDGRLERMAYLIMLRNGIDPGAWLGDPFEVQSAAAGELRRVSIEELTDPGPRGVFKRREHSHSGFLDLWQGTFREHDSNGEIIAESAREYYYPTVESGLGRNKVALLPVTRSPEGEILIGLDLNHYPAAQEHPVTSRGDPLGSGAGGSRLATVLSYRLSNETKRFDEALSFSRGVLGRDWGLSARRLFRLGGGYFSSPGVTPDLTYPILVETAKIEHRGRSLHWIPIDRAAGYLGSFRDASTITALARCGHLLGSFVVHARQREAEM